MREPILPSKRFSRSLRLGSTFRTLWILSLGFPLSHVVKCGVAPLPRQVFSSCSASQSRPLPFFPPRCTFLVATTIACCLCRLARVTSTNGVGRVAKFVRRQLLQFLRCTIMRCGLGFSNLAGGFRGGRPRSTTRAQEAASLTDETLNFFVKATGKDEASMRQKLTSQKREELRRSRDYWKARAEDEERFQKMKEEAWRLFERQPGFKRKTREEFEEELTRKVRNTPGNNRGEREKMMQKWSSEMQRVVQPEERRHEARVRTKMEQEDSNSQRQRTWEKIRGPRIPVPMPPLAPEK